MTLSYYDVLDVDPQASTEEIRAAWRSAVADLDPTDRRFRAYNNAAEVLLDPDRRAAHDAELTVAAEDAEEPGEAAGEPSPEPDVRTTEEAPATDRSAGEETTATGTSATGATIAGEDTTSVDAVAAAPGRRRIPAWLLALLAGTTVVVAGAAAFLSVAVPSEGAVRDATGEARATAERAIEPVLSYDAADLDASRSDAQQYLTEDFTQEYAKIFDGIVQGNAPRLGTTVEGRFVASAVTRTDVDTWDEPDTVQVLLFVDQSVTNKQRSEPVVNRNQVTVTMQREDGEWLIDALRTSPLPE